jgi:hypothetical protein
MISLFSPELLATSLLFNTVCIAIFAFLIKKVYGDQDIIKMHSIIEILLFLFGIWCLIGIAVLRLTVEITIVSSIEFVFLFSCISAIIFLIVIILIGCAYLLMGKSLKK